jgi:hypothetical protein
MESDPAGLGRRRCHKFTNGIEDYFELGIVLFLQGYEFSIQVCMRGKHPAQPDKSAHDLDVDLDRPGLLSTLESIATPCSVKA